MKNVIKTLLVAIVSCVLSFSTVSAASATIFSTPTGGSRAPTEQFDIEIKVSSTDQAFTSFGATVTTSNLTIISLTKAANVEHCTVTPTKDSLNFYCGVTGSTNATSIYTMKVRPNTTGTAQVNISNCSIKRTDGITVTEICTGASGSSFTVASNPQSLGTPRVTATVSPTPTVSDSEMPTETPSITDTPTIQEKNVAVVTDERGNVLANAIVKINGIEYITNSNGEIILRNPLKDSDEVVIVLGDKTISGKIKAGSVEVVSELDSNLSYTNWILLILLAIATIIVLFYFVTRKK